MSAGDEALLTGPALRVYARIMAIPIELPRMIRLQNDRPYVQISSEIISIDRIAPDLAAFWTDMH